MKVIIEATDKEIADLILQLQRSAELDDSEKNEFVKSMVELINKETSINSDKPLFV